MPIACATVKNGTHTLGPDNGTLQVKTYRTGMAQKAGHDLVLDVTSWKATVDVDEDSNFAVELSADPRSLRVRDGHGGVKPLTDKDRADIHKSIDDKVLKGKAITFKSGEASSNGAGPASVTGEVSMGGNSRPVTFEVHVAADGQINSTVSLTQSEWGIKPYSGLMGALKVRDEVEVVLEGRLPAA
jgi:polyisoprenoid-binding protein YceI